MLRRFIPKMVELRRSFPSGEEGQDGERLEEESLEEGEKHAMITEQPDQVHQQV